MAYEVDYKVRLAMIDAVTIKLEPTSEDELQLIREVTEFLTNYRKFNSIDLKAFLQDSTYTGYSQSDIKLVQRTSDFLAQTWPGDMVIDPERVEQLKHQIAEVRRRARAA